MRTDLDHLPEAKRRELGRVVQILFEEFEAATANKSHQHLKRGRILKVVLFGSYARGDWEPLRSVPKAEATALPQSGLSESPQ